MNLLAEANALDQTIRVNNAQPWFFDLDPLHSTAFGPFQQTLFRDLSASDQNSEFTGPVPPLLEVGYQAGAVAGSPALNNYDAFSVLLHEMGHLSGINENILVAECAAAIDIHRWGGRSRSDPRG